MMTTTMRQSELADDNVIDGRIVGRHLLDSSLSLGVVCDVASSWERWDTFTIARSEAILLFSTKFGVRNFPADPSIVTER